MQMKIPQIKIIKLAKVVLRGKFQALNSCIETIERSCIRDLGCHLKKLRREDKIKPYKV